MGVDLALEADAAAVAAKSRALGAMFQQLMAAECASFGFRLASPDRPEQRGSQICYGHPEGYAIMQVPDQPLALLQFIKVAAGLFMATDAEH